MARIDLHRHLEGSHSPAALAEVARTLRIPALCDPATGTPLGAEAIARLVVMAGPGPFDVFHRHVLHTRRAYASLEAVEALTRLACLELMREADRCELRFGLYSMTRDLLANTGVKVDDVDDVAFADVHARGVLEAVLRGRDAAAREGGVAYALRLGFSRTFERPSKYLAMARMVREYAPRLCGMDVQGAAPAGREEELPEALVGLVRSLRDVLPDLTLHAGELEGPASVERALVLEPQGIGHGVRSVESPALLRQLARAGVTLEVCPTSNGLLIPDAIARLTQAHGAHPLRVLLDAGVACALCTDDPANFGTDLQREHRAAEALGAPLHVLHGHAERRWAQVAGRTGG